MNTIEIDEYKFLEVSNSPNIIISLKGKKNFCELSQSDKSYFMESHFKLSSYSEFNQVHSFLVNGHDMSEKNEFDGFITKQKNHAYAIKTADCVPLILWDENKELLCGLHCGWKGLRKGIIGRILEENNYKSMTEAFIGPHISEKHFEVKQDLIKKFQEGGIDIRPYLVGNGEKIFMDLRQFCVDELHDYGIQIMTKFSLCSFTENDHFFSWRREPGNPLRNLTIAWL